MSEHQKKSSRNGSINVKKAKKKRPVTTPEDAVQLEKSERLTARLIIDIGTHAVRAAIVCFDSGKPVIESIFSSSLAITRHSNSHVEQSPDDIVQKMLSVIQQALSSSDKKVSKAALAIQRSTVVAWTPDGRALSPALSWQDTRASLFIHELKKTSATAKIQYISGLPLSPHYGASKLRWLAEGLGDSYKNDQLRLSPLVSYVLFHLLEQQPYVCDESNGGRTQLMDIRAREWSASLCDIFDVPLACLPKLVPIKHKYGRIKGTDIELELVSGDQNAAYQYIRWMGQQLTPISPADPFQGNPPKIHSEELKSRHTTCIAINAGSGAFILMEDNVDVYIEQDNERKGPEFSADDSSSVFENSIPENFQGYHFIKSLVFSDKESTDYVLEGTVNGVGTALSWMYEQWKMINAAASEDDFFTYIANMSFDKKPSIIFINTIGGLGSPFWHSGEAARFVDLKKIVFDDGKLHDQSLTSAYLTDADIEQRMDECINAVIESIAFLIVMNIDGMSAENSNDVNVEFNVFVSGGVSRVSVLVQKISDLLSLSIYRLNDFDATVLGLSVSIADDVLMIENSEQTLAEFRPNNLTKESQQLKKRYAVFKDVLTHCFL